MERAEVESGYDGVQHGPPPGTTVPCGSCGRKFNPTSLQKHEPICFKSKANAKKRGAFDTSKQRGVGGAIKVKASTAREINQAKQKGLEKAAAAKKPAEWRNKHEEFVGAIRAARQAKAHVANGGKLSDLPPPKPAENPDYISCPHCERRFNETAGKRHIKFCGEKAKREALKKGPSGKTEKTKKAQQDMRTKYKPPPPGSARTPSRAPSAKSARRASISGLSSPRSPQPPKSAMSQSMRGANIRGATPKSAGRGRVVRQASSPTPSSSLSGTGHFDFSQTRQAPDLDFLQPPNSARNGSAGSIGSRGSSGGLHRAGANFCGQCGASYQNRGLAHFCVECGEEFASGKARFCGKCGARRQGC